ncbi:MAG TPA: fused MFS/spermidine synthase [Actinomycetes bacterium]|nr:fused MFS/spermidine synthase [Actinomycetes bacterium]
MALRTRTAPPAPARSTWTRAPRGLILAVFVVSGAAGLIYQVVWSRELVLLFGNTTQAVATIVTAFMAGLGLGSLVGGRVADAASGDPGGGDAAARAPGRRPLVVYGLLEAGIALLALALPFAFGALGDVYGGSYGSLVGRPALLTLTRFGLAFAAVAPATFLMGMTLPVLSRYLVRTLDETGARLSELYAANTLGAMAGTLLAGFVLIELLGLTLAGVVAVACNLFAAAVALGLALRRPAAPAAAAEGPGAPEAAPAAAPDREEGAGSRGSAGPAGAGAPEGAGPPAVRAGAGVGGRRRAVLLATFVSGFVALALEVLWTRMVAEGTGSSIYVFTGILAIYLAGIGLGSAAYRRWGRAERDLPGVLGLCLAGVGIAAVVTVVLGSGVIATPPFALRALLVFLPATTLMGYGFPLAGKLVTPAVERTGSSIGLLYAANTLGSILGSFAAAFVLAATLGTNGSILALAGLDLLVGAWLVLTEPSWRRARRRTLAAVLALVAVLGVAASSLALPITRTRTENALRAEGVPVTHTEDELATVDAVGGPVPGRRLLIGGVGVTSLSVDTKLMAYLPRAARPGAREFLVIAMGMGSTYRSGLLAGMRTDVVELSPSVPGMMGVFHPDAGRWLRHPRGRVIVTDGRNYVRLSHERYDLVTVDPAPPIESAGSVVLYTREFLTESKARLNPGGLFTLWMPYALPMEDFKTHVRTFRAVFPHTTLVLSPGHHGVYMMGSDDPISFSEADVRAQVGNPRTMADLAEMPDHPAGITGPEGWVQAVRRAEWLRDEQVDAFTGPGPLITDDRPRSEYFLWRRALLHDKWYISEPALRAAAHP